MATLQRFKLLATQCSTAAAHSPARSPSASPRPAKSPSSFHLLRRRHRSTLRRLLIRRKGRSDPKVQLPDREEEGKGLLRHTSLKDLFVSSSSPSQSSSSLPPPPPQPPGEGEAGGGGGGRGFGWRLGFEGLVRRGGGVGRMRSAAGGGGGALRYRLLRRAWRPVLVTIPE